MRKILSTKIIISYIPSSNEYLNNTFFDIKMSRDNCLQPFSRLKTKLEKSKFIVNTFDVNQKYEKIDVVIIHRIDVNFKNILIIVKKNPGVRIIYTNTEERTICPFHTREILKSRLFDVVLTWDDQMIDGKYFLKYNYPNAKLKVTKIIPFKEKLFITMINGYKFSNHNKVGELYTNRIEALNYFSDKDCDLYGTGWNKCMDRKILDIYKGEVKSKNATLKNYKFSICFENTSNEYGAIMEKIFDCFAAGCVPIYLGAPNIDVYIPKKCFIDFRDFDTYDELYHFLKKISESEYDQYIESIKEFMASDEYDDFNEIGYIRYMESAINKVMGSAIVERGALNLKMEWIKKILVNPNIFWNKAGLKMLLKVVFS
jgi:hypothetical protein